MVCGVGFSLDGGGRIEFIRGAGGRPAPGGGSLAPAAVPRLQTPRHAVAATPGGRRAPPGPPEGSSGGGGDASAGAPVVDYSVNVLSHHGKTHPLPASSHSHTAFSASASASRPMNAQSAPAPLRSSVAGDAGSALGVHHGLSWLETMYGGGGGGGVGASAAAALSDLVRSPRSAPVAPALKSAAVVVDEPAWRRPPMAPLMPATRPRPSTGSFAFTSPPPAHAAAGDAGLSAAAPVAAPASAPAPRRLSPALREPEEAAMPLTLTTPAAPPVAAALELAPPAPAPAPAEADPGLRAEVQALRDQLHTVMDGMKSVQQKEQALEDEVRYLRGRLALEDRRVAASPPPPSHAQPQEPKPQAKPDPQPATSPPPQQDLVVVPHSSGTRSQSAAARPGPVESAAVGRLTPPPCFQHSIPTAAATRHAPTGTRSGSPAASLTSDASLHPSFEVQPPPARSGQTRSAAGLLATDGFWQRPPTVGNGSNPAAAAAAAAAAPTSSLSPPFVADAQADSPPPHAEARSLWRSASGACTAGEHSRRSSVVSSVAVSALPRPPPPQPATAPRCWQPPAAAPQGEAAEPAPVAAALPVRSASVAVSVRSASAASSLRCAADPRAPRDRAQLSRVRDDADEGLRYPDAEALQEARRAQALPAQFAAEQAYVAGLRASVASRTASSASAASAVVPEAWQTTPVSTASAAAQQRHQQAPAAGSRGSAASSAAGSPYVATVASLEDGASPRIAEIHAMSTTPTRPLSAAEPLATSAAVSAVRSWASAASSAPSKQSSRASNVQIAVENLDGHSLTLTLSTAARVAEIKRHVQLAWGCAVEGQRLVLGGRALQDDDTLEDCGVTVRGTIVHVLTDVAQPASTVSHAAPQPSLDQWSYPASVRAASTGSSGTCAGSAKRRHSTTPTLAPHVSRGESRRASYSTATLAPSFQLTVQDLVGSSLRLPSLAPTATVLEVKQIIQVCGRFIGALPPACSPYVPTQESWGIVEEKQRLIFKAQQLQNDWTYVVFAIFNISTPSLPHRLEEQGVKNGDTLHILAGLPPVPSNRSSVGGRSTTASGQ